MGREWTAASLLGGVASLGGVPGGLPSLVPPPLRPARRVGLPVRSARGARRGEGSCGGCAAIGMYLEAAWGWGSG